jgi:hypothetical protein
LAGKPGKSHTDRKAREALNAKCAEAWDNLAEAGVEITSAIARLDAVMASLPHDIRQQLADQAAQARAAGDRMVAHTTCMRSQLDAISAPGRPSNPAVRRAQS